MAILDRIRDRSGVFLDLDDLTDQASEIARTNGFHPKDVADGATSAASDAASEAAARLSDAAKSASGTAKVVAKDASDATRDRIESLGEILRDLAREWSKAGNEMHLDARLDEVVNRLRAAMPASAFRGAVARLERELPDTDKDRYDRAYERGRAQTRAVFVVGGLAAGIAAGIAGAMLLDPQRGAARREQLAKLRDNATSQIGAKSKELTEKAKSMAAERGIGQAKTAPDPTGVTTDREMVPVMPVGEDIVTDPSSIVREPLPGVGGGIEHGAPGADAPSTVDATGDRAVTATHG